MWILIIFMYGSSMNSLTIEFQNKVSCEAAKAQVLETSPGRIRAICIEHYKK